MTPHQCRAARALVSLTQTELADKAGIGISSVVYFEKEKRPVSTQIVERMQRALEQSEVIFVDGENGAGVRLARSAEMADSIGLHGEQLRSARAFLGWNQTVLGLASGINPKTIARLERNDGPIDGYASTLRAIIHALHEAGIVLTDGRGFCFAKRVQTASV